MIRNAFFVGRKDVKYALRQRETLLWVFIMPIVFFYFIGMITGGGSSGGGTTATPLALRVGENAGFLAEELIRQLEAADFEIRHPESNEAFDTAGRRLIIPPHFSEQVLAGEQTELRLIPTDSESMAGNFDEVRVQRVIYTLLADLLLASEKGENPNAETMERIASLPRHLHLEVARASKRRHIPTGFEQAIPGTMVMFTLLVLISTGAVLLVVERHQGLLRRLASAPMSRASIVLGKWGGRLALGLVQIAFAMIAGTVIFGMDWGKHMPMLLLVLASWAAFCASVAMLLGCLARSEGQAIGLGIVSANVLAALGGCWWPIEVTPSWMQSLSRWLPTGWAMHAMHQLVSFGAGPTSVLPDILFMLLAAIAIGFAATRVFRFI